MARSKRLEALYASNEESNRITRQSIQTALLYIMNKKELDKISIKEIVIKAGVSRASFYNNYESKEDVLLDFTSNVLEIIESSLDNDEYKDNPYEWFNFLFMIIKINSNVLSLLAKHNVNFAHKLIKPNLTNPMYEYKFQAMQAGLNTIITNWISSGMKESSDTMAKLCVELFPQFQSLLKEGITRDE